MYALTLTSFFKSSLTYIIEVSMVYKCSSKQQVMIKLVLIYGKNQWPPSSTSAEFTAHIYQSQHHLQILKMVLSRICHSEDNLVLSSNLPRIHVYGDRKSNGSFTVAFDPIFKYQRGINVRLNFYLQSLKIIKHSQTLKMVTTFIFRVALIIFRVTKIIFREFLQNFQTNSYYS